MFNSLMSYLVTIPINFSCYAVLNSGPRPPLHLCREEAEKVQLDNRNYYENKRVETIVPGGKSS